MEKRKIILDCDPGHDDAIAMMMAAKHPAIELLGITIVAGNQTLDKTLVNGLNVCQKLGIDVPVYAGMPRPIMREQIVAADIRGESGLDGPVFEPLTKKQEPVHAVSYIIDTLMALRCRHYAGAGGAADQHCRCHADGTGHCIENQGDCPDGRRLWNRKCDPVGRI